MVIKKRILALDIGTKRIGVAISDAMWLGATPVCTLDRKDDNKALEDIKKIANEYLTDLILIGIPYNMDGTLGFQAKNCLNFIKPLEDEYTILKQDERLSSAAAEDYLKQQNKKYTKDKGLVDKVAACVILQEYLENNR